MPAGIDDGDAQFNDHDVIRIIGVPDAIEVGAGEHRVDLRHARGDAMEGDAEQLGMTGHDLLGQRLGVDLVGGGRPIFWSGLCG